MIFLTVGSLDPFDRLVEAVDQWAGQQASPPTIFGQIAKAQFRPLHFPTVEFITQEEYRQKFEKAALIVSHAGTGSILAALELGKQIIVMPKRASLGEQRNEHQLATARRFRTFSNLIVADTSTDLQEALTRFMMLKEGSDFAVPKGILRPASSLIDAIRDFVSASSESGRP